MSSVLLSALLTATTWVSQQPAAASQPAVAPGERPGLELIEPFASLGEVYQFSELEHTFRLVNHDLQPVRVLAVEALSTGGRVVAAPQVLAAGATAEIRVFQAVGNRLGETSFRFLLRTDHPSAAERKLALSVFVQSAYDPEQRAVDFGDVVRGQEATQIVELASRETRGSTLSLVGLAGAPTWLTARALEPLTADQGLRVALTLTAEAPQGVLTGAVQLRTSLAHQPLHDVRFRASVFGRIVPSPTHVDFSWLHLGGVAERKVYLRARDQQPFDVTAIDPGHPSLQVTEAACDDQDASCRLLQLRLVPEASGSIGGTLRIMLPGDDPLAIHWAALAVLPGTEVKDVTAALERPPFLDDEVSPVTRAPVGAARRGVDSPTEKLAVTVRWQARQEARAYGYLVYRAKQRSGPYQRINDSIVQVLVPASGVAQSSYSYTDRDVEPGQTYFYYLDLVTHDGRKERFSGVLSRTVAADATP